jgi:hypothetical protein
MHVLSATWADGNATTSCRSPMLSLEASRLTNLILTRHTLECRAVELEVRLNMLALLECAPDLPLALHGASGEDACPAELRDAAAAELKVLPALLAGVEERIRLAWQRLQSASPTRRS